MMRSVLSMAACLGLALSATQASAKKVKIETLYDDALECRLAAFSVLQVLKKSEPQDDEQVETIQTVEGTESFYHKLSLMLGRQLGKREPLIGMDYANLQLDLAQTILTQPNAMGAMVQKTKTCGEAISEAEKA